MIHPLLNIREIKIPAELNTIIKYHKPSKVFMNEDTAVQYSKWIKIYVLVIDEFTADPAYNYNEIVDKTFPEFVDKSRHQNNILAMVGNLIELEWNYVIEARQHIQIHHSANEEINISDYAVSLLQSLNKLIEIKQQFIQDTDIVINPKKSTSSHNHKKHLIRDLQIKIDGDLKVKKQIIDLLIKNRIDELNSPLYTFLNFNFSSRNISHKKINKLIDQLTFTKSFEDLAYLFKKRVCHLLLFYMRAEMGWHDKKKTLTEAQGEFIYTVLLLFNLMEPEALIGHHNPRKKTNYVWTFFKTDPKYKDVKFPEIIFKEFKAKIHVVKRHLKRKKQILSGKN